MLMMFTAMSAADDVKLKIVLNDNENSFNGVPGDSLKSINALYEKLFHRESAPEMKSIVQGNENIEANTRLIFCAQLGNNSVYLIGARIEDVKSGMVTIEINGQRITGDEKIEDMEAKYTERLQVGLYYEVYADKLGNVAMVYGGTPLKLEKVYYQIPK